MDLSKFLRTTPNFMVIMEGCPYCRAADSLLKSKGIRYESFPYEEHPDLDREVTASTNHTTYPKIYLDGKFVGGFDELKRRDTRGEL